MNWLQRRIFIFLLVALVIPIMGIGGSTAHAQGEDPVLAGMILMYTDKAKKELKQQRRDDASGEYRSCVDYRRGQCHYRPAETVQQLP
jgi:hypothetical protein